MVSEVEVALRFLPQFHRRHRHQRQDDDDRAHWTFALHRWRSVATAGNIAAVGGRVEHDPAWVALGPSFQLHDTPSVAPRVGC
jgi:hypothetical protein